MSKRFSMPEGYSGGHRPELSKQSDVALAIPESFAVNQEIAQGLIELEGDQQNKWLRTVPPEKQGLAKRALWAMMLMASSAAAGLGCAVPPRVEEPPAIAKAGQAPDIEGPPQGALEGHLTKEEEQWIEDMYEKHRYNPWWVLERYKEGFEKDAPVQTLLAMIKESLKKYVDNFEILSHAALLTEFEWGSALVQSIAETANYKDLLDNADKIKKFDWSPPLVRQKVDELLRSEYYGKIVRYAGQLEDYSETADLILAAANRASPHELITAGSALLHYEWSSDMLQRAVEQADPDTIVAYAFEIIDYDWAKECIRKAAEDVQDKSLVAWSVHEVLACPNGERIAREAFEEVALTHPNVVLAQGGHLNGLDWAEGVIRLAAEKDPWEFVDLHTIFDFLPNSDTIFKNAQERIAIAQKGLAIPEKTIEKKDFPLNAERFPLYLLGMNRHSREKTFNWISGGYNLISIPPEKFNQVFFAPSFQAILQERAGDISYINAFSVAQAVHRRIAEQGGDFNDKTIRHTAEIIFGEREAVRDRELFGPSTKLILFTHEDEEFNNDVILEKIYFRAGGTKENIIANEKGGGKQIVLNAIRESKGTITVLFSGHGSKENWAFSSNYADALDSSVTPHDSSVNYQELGDALIASGNVKNINLIGATCLSYDYLRNLFRYLQEKGIQERPHVSISSANAKKFGWLGGKELDDRFLDALYRASEAGKPITVDTFYKAEGRIWYFEDPAIFIQPPASDALPLEIGMGARGEEALPA